MALASTVIKVEFLSVFTFIDGVTFGCRKLLFLFLLLADAYIQSKFKVGYTFYHVHAGSNPQLLLCYGKTDSWKYQTINLLDDFRVLCEI